MASFRVPVALLGILAACGGGEVRVGKARLAEADAIEKAPPGRTVEMPPPPPAPPGENRPAIEYPVDVRPGETGPVRIAADRDVPYYGIVAAAERITDAGAKPVFLVAKRGELGILP